MNMLHVSLVPRSYRSFGICFALAAVLVVAIGASTWATEQEVHPIGEQLVRQFWEAVRTVDVDALEGILAPGFQSVHQDGARNRDEELALVAGVDIDDYTLSEFATTRQGATIVVTYMASVGETIAGTRTTTPPAPRMTVFLMTESGWQLVAHANLKALGSS